MTEPSDAAIDAALDAAKELIEHMGDFPKLIDCATNFIATIIDKAIVNALEPERRLVKNLLEALESLIRPIEEHWRDYDEIGKRVSKAKAAIAVFEQAEVKRLREALEYIGECCSDGRDHVIPDVVQTALSTAPGED